MTRADRRHRWPMHVRPRRGAALLMALIAISVLATVTALAGRIARDSAAITVNRRAQLTGRAMAQSGVVAARTAFEERLRRAPDSVAVDALFDGLEHTTPWISDSVADGGYAANLVNVSARLDVNSAGADGLAALFRTVAPATEATTIATMLSDRVNGVELPQAVRDSALARDSLVATLLGRTTPPRAMRPFESLDDVQALVGTQAPWLLRLAEQLTVDGDGRIDRRHASPAVQAAASGSLVDRPTRLLIVARGWHVGAASAQEIQALYAIEGTATEPELRLVRWRERER